MEGLLSTGLTPSSLSTISSLQIVGAARQFIGTDCAVCSVPCSVCSVLKCADNSVSCTVFSVMYSMQCAV